MRAHLQARCRSPSLVHEIGMRDARASAARLETRRDRRRVALSARLPRGRSHMTAVHELASYEKTDRWSLAAPVARSCWVGWKRSAEIGPRRDPQKSECAWVAAARVVAAGRWGRLGGGGGWVVGAALVHVAITPACACACACMGRARTQCAVCMACIMAVP